MKKKIIMGSIFAVLILLSMPMISNIQAQPTPVISAVPATTNVSPADIDTSTISTEELVIEVQIIVDAISKEYSHIPKVQTLCQKATAALATRSDGFKRPVCTVLKFLHVILLVLLILVIVVGNMGVSTISIMWDIIFALRDIEKAIDLIPFCDVLIRVPGISVSSGCSLCGSSQ